jgi:DNA-binding IclR family transcriptional regulator
MAQPPSKKLPKPTVREQVIAFIKGRREFTIPELVRATDGTEAQVWRMVRKLIRKGVVRPTDRTKAVEVGPKKKEEASRVYEYVGGAE